MLTQEAFHLLKTPTLTDSHESVTSLTMAMSTSTFQGKAIVSHLESDAQADPALCCPE